MTAVCHETGENIINPFIGIRDFNDKGKLLGTTYINTQIFKPYQEEIIHPIDDDVRLKMERARERLYDVWAIVGEYNTNSKTVSLRPPRAEVFLGYLSGEVVQNHLPNTYEYFDSLRNA